jgi:hypothetical protein
LRQDFFENSKFFSEATPSLIRPDKTEVKWHSFAAKSQVLSPKAQARCRSALDGTEKVSAILRFVILRWHRAPRACLTFDVQCPPDFFVGAHAELIGWKLTTRMSSATAFIFRERN